MSRQGGPWWGLLVGGLTGNWMFLGNGTAISSGPHMRSTL